MIGRVLLLVYYGVLIALVLAGVVHLVTSWTSEPPARAEAPRSAPSAAQTEASESAVEEGEHDLSETVEGAGRVQESRFPAGSDSTPGVLATPAPTETASPSDGAAAVVVPPSPAAAAPSLEDAEDRPEASSSTYEDAPPGPCDCDEPPAPSNTGGEPEPEDTPILIPAHERDLLTPYEAGLQASGSEAWARTWDAITYCETRHDSTRVGAAGEAGQGQIHPVNAGLVAALGYTWQQLTDPLVNAIVGFVLWVDRDSWDPLGGWNAWSWCARQIGVVG